MCSRRAFLTSLALVAFAAPAVAQEFLTEFLEYVAWDGTHWSVRREGAGFLHIPRGAVQPVPNEALNYLSWDGSRWSARWSGEALVQQRQGAARAPQELLHFVDWQGRRWIARWDPAARKFRVRSGGV